MSKARNIADLMQADGSVEVDRIGSDGTIIELRKDGTPVGSIGTTLGGVTLGSGDTGLFVYDDATQERIVPWNTSTNNVKDNLINLGQANSRFKDLYLSGGVYVGGTGAANHLDDYEEGTWTGSINTTSGTTGTFSAVSGTYSKVGRVVTVTGTMTGTSMSFTNSSSYVRITGLPFTAPSGNYVGTVGGNSVTTGIDGVVLIGSGTGASPYLYAVHSSTAVAALYFTVTYETV